MSVLAASIDKPPHKLSPIHQYFKLYYVSRVKPEFIRRFTVTKESWDSATDEEKANGLVKKPVAVKMRAELSREIWLLETDELHEEVTQDAVNPHAQKMKAWEVAKSVPKTPQEFHQYVEQLEIK